MFRKLLLKALRNLKPEEKKMFREILEDKEDVVDEKISETMENKGESDEMEDEKKLTEEERVEDGNPVEKVEEEVKDEEKVEKEDKAEDENLDNEKTEEIKEEVKEEPVEETADPIVQNEQPSTPNAVRVEDLITRDELTEKLQALSAKLDAVLKENEDLKNKYERKDFGNFQKKGVADPDRHANSSFEEYSKDFM